MSSSSKSTSPDKKVEEMPLPRPKEVDKRDLNTMPICRYYATNSCHMGKLCRFRHPAINVVEYQQFNELDADPYYNPTRPKTPPIRTPLLPAPMQPPPYGMPFYHHPLAYPMPPPPHHRTAAPPPPPPWFMGFRYPCYLEPYNNPGDVPIHPPMISLPPHPPYGGLGPHPPFPQSPPPPPPPAPPSSSSSSLPQQHQSQPRTKMNYQERAETSVKRRHIEAKSSSVGVISSPTKITTTSSSSMRNRREYRSPSPTLSRRESREKDHRFVRSPPPLPPSHAWKQDKSRSFSPIESNNSSISDCDDNMSLESWPTMSFSSSDDESKQICHEARQCKRKKACSKKITNEIISKIHMKRNWVSNQRRQRHQYLLMKLLLVERAIAKKKLQNKCKKSKLSKLHL